MDFQTYTDQLSARITAHAGHPETITAMREQTLSVVHWTRYGRRVSAIANANTAVIFQAEIEDENSVRRWEERDDLATPCIDRFATMIASFLEGNGAEVLTLKDAEIIPNYSFAGTGRTDTGEELLCSRCGKHSTGVGTESHVWNRTPNKSTYLPRSIELCETCDHQVRQLQSNEPR